MYCTLASWCVRKGVVSIRHPPFHLLYFSFFPILSRSPSPTSFIKLKKHKKNYFLCHSFILPPGVSKENWASQVW